MQDNQDMEVRERLVSLETKLAFIQTLLEEIKQNLREQPSKEEVNDLDERLSKIEESQTKLTIKVGVVSGFLGMLGGYLVRFFVG